MEPGLVEDGGDEIVFLQSAEEEFEAGVVADEEVGYQPRCNPRRDISVEDGGIAG